MKESKWWKRVAIKSKICWSRKIHLKKRNVMKNGALCVQKNMENSNYHVIQTIPGTGGYAGHANKTKILSKFMRAKPLDP